LTCGCLALLLVTVVPVGVVVVVASRGGFDHGFAQSYVSQRQAGLGQIDSQISALRACEAAGGTQPCYPQADTLSSGASDESQLIGRESGLFFFPPCLRPSAADERSALEALAQASQAVRTFPPVEVGGVRDLLDEIGTARAAAGAAVTRSKACG
jgi:hypothetical protein